MAVDRTKRALGGAVRPSVGLLAIALAFGGCGGEEGGPPPLELGEIREADDVEYDVAYREGVLLADEEDVLRDVQALQPTDGVFRVDAGSPLLDGLAVGSLVVWPQIGFLEILDLRERDDVVEVEAQYAPFGDVVAEGEVRFEHALSAGEPGRAVGMAPPEAPGSSTGAVRQALEIPGGAELTEDGVAYDGEAEPYGVDYGVMIGGDRMSVELTAESGSVSATMAGEIRGLRAEGLILMDPEAEDPSVLIEFHDVTVDVDVTLRVEGAEGEADLLPPAQLTFPFMLGPVPAYVGVGTRLQVRSSISRGDTILSTSAGFSMSGSVVVARNDDGSFGADGELGTFEGRSPSIEFETVNTAGIGIDVDAPRISFGIGRPGIAAASVFGTHSAEIVANVTVAPEGEYCGTAGTGGAIQVGGEMGFFGWSLGGDPVPVATYDGETTAVGTICE
ncbi:MAG: hypothetical protein ACOC97_04025 [Myxococcota bacterium]